MIYATYWDNGVRIKGGSHFEFTPIGEGKET